MCDGAGLIPTVELDGDPGVSACHGCRACAALTPGARRAFAAADYGDEAF